MNVLQNSLLTPHGKIEKGVNIYEQYIYICDVPLTFSGQLLVKKVLKSYLGIFWATEVRLSSHNWYQGCKSSGWGCKSSGRSPTGFFPNWDIPQLVLFAFVPLRIWVPNCRYTYSVGKEAWISFNSSDFQEHIL